ncbi:tetratricopeptide repeat protein [Maricaulaceae bacterium EIL42A08]|nr:tetratricopeptide repeat protein [Maricaulaceae bacterium EIL42A08]
MVDVFDEVEEELRQERYQALLRKWGPWVLGGAVAIVAGVAGYQIWLAQSTAAAEASSDTYIEASTLFEEGDLAAANSAFADMAESGPAGYATLSLLRQGEIAIAENRATDAARFFEQAAARAPEPLTRQLAQYKAALALFDTLSYDDLSVRLTPLTEGDAYFGSLARELIAAAAMRDGRWDEARGEYELLSISLDAPPGVSRRANEALVYIRQNAPEAVAEEVVAPVEAAEPSGDETTETDSGEGGQ